MISVVLGSYNRFAFLKLAINSVRHQQVTVPLEIIVIDGGSQDGSLEWLLEQKDIITIVQHNRGEWLGKKIERRSWGYFMNLGFKIASGKYICMISDDCIIVPGALENGMQLFERCLAEGQKVAAAAFYWRETGKDRQFHIGTPFGNLMYLNHGLYLKAALQDVNYIDEKAFNFYWADVDLCFRFYQAGYIVVESPDSYVEHYPHANLEVRKNNESSNERDKKAFFQRWLKVFPSMLDRELSIQKKKSFIDLEDTAQKFLLVGGRVTHSPAKTIGYALYRDARSLGGQLLRRLGLYKKLGE